MKGLAQSAARTSQLQQIRVTQLVNFAFVIVSISSAFSSSKPCHDMFAYVVVLEAHLEVELKRLIGLFDPIAFQPINRLQNQ